MFRVSRGFLFCLLLAAMPGALSVTGLAQSMLLDLPLQSQRAEVSQRIGLQISRSTITVRW